MQFDFLRLLVKMLDTTLNEESLEFKAYLLDKGIEIEVERIPFIHHRSIQFQFEEEKNFDKYYSFIDKNIFKKVLKILTDSGNEDKIYRISLILKVAYYDVIKAKLSAEAKSNAFEAEVELDSILKFIGQEKEENQKEITKVKFETNQTASTLVLKNTIIINYLMSILKSVTEDYFDYLELDGDENREDYEWHFQKSKYSKAHNFFIYLATIDMLKYLVFTSEEDRLLEEVNLDYSNKQLVVAFNLLEAANLVDEDDKLDEQKHKYLRKKISDTKKQFDY